MALESDLKPGLRDSKAMRGIGCLCTQGGEAYHMDMTNPIDKDELKKRLTPEEFNITQEKGTEAPFTGIYWDNHDAGVYRCKVCGAALFKSENKYDSGSGWPSFDQAIPGATRQLIDDSHGMTRTEVTCANCGAHLGHMFEDGPKETTGQRFCMNSASLDLEKKDSA